MKTINNLLGIGVLLIVAACAQQPVEQAVEPAEATRTPFAVGSTTRFIRDTSRRYDSVAGVYDGIRTLVTEVWYPISWEDAESGDYRQATYGDYVFGDADAHRRMMTQTTFFHLTPDTVRDGVTQAQIDSAIDELFHRKRASYVDAPVAKLDKPLPVIVMSHGDAGSRYNMESACEYLAAHGYLVIAPEHTGNSPYSLSFEDPALSESATDESTGSSDSRYRRAMEAVKPHLNEFGSYGEVSHYGQSYSPLSEDRTSPQFFQYMDASFLQRVNDLRATLDELTRMSIEGPFAGTIDWKRAGLMGRSFGGATTLAGLALEAAFCVGAGRCAAFHAGHTAGAAAADAEAGRYRVTAAECRRAVWPGPYFQTHVFAKWRGRHADYWPRCEHGRTHGAAGANARQPASGAARGLRICAGAGGLGAAGQLQSRQLWRVRRLLVAEPETANAAAAL